MKQEDMQFGYIENYSPKFDETKSFYLIKIVFFIEDWNGLMDQKYIEKLERVGLVEILKQNNLIFHFSEDDDLIYVYSRGISNNEEEVEVVLYRKSLLGDTIEYNLKETQIYYEVLKDTNNPLLVKYLKKILYIMLKQEQVDKETELENLKEKINNLIHLKELKEV